MARKKYSIGFRLTAALAAILIFIVLVEAVLRLVAADDYFQNRFFIVNRALDYPEIFQRDRDLFWRFRPDRTVTSKFFEGETYRINSQGLRGDEVPVEKTSKRIITLGNSCTFGWGVPLAQTYSEQLEKNLQRQHEVINGAVPGYSTFQGRKFFESDLSQLNPDIVTVLFAWNDHWAAASQIADKDQEFPPQIILAAQNFLARFHFYRLMKKTLLSAVEKNPDSTFDRGNIVYRVGLDDFGLNLKEICERVREAGATPILLTSPIPSLEKYYLPGARSSLHAFHEKYNQMIRNVSAANDIDLVDLAREFDKHDGLWDDAPRDPIHFNARGHALAARLIADYIEKNIGP